MVARFTAFMRMVVSKQQLSQSVNNFKGGIIENSAATIIQSFVRSWLIRRKYKFGNNTDTFNYDIEFDKADKASICYDKKGKVITSCTLAKLIEQLTVAQKSDSAWWMSAQFEDTNLTPMILLTFPIIMPTTHWFRVLMQRYEKAKSSAVMDGVVEHIAKWLQLHPLDFSLNSACRSLLIKFAEEHHSTELIGALAKATNKLKGETNFLDSVGKITDYPPMKLPKNFSEETPLFEIPPRELARQLTLLDHEIFTKVQGREFLKQAWAKPALQMSAANLLAFITRFNHISGWIASEIVAQKSLKERSKSVVKAISIAEHCMELNNFNALIAIISILQNSSISRLKLTWAVVPSSTMKMYKKLCSLCSVQNNYAKYRNAIANAPRPLVPFLGAYLHDLVVIDEMPLTIPSPDSSDGEEHVNLEKPRTIHNTITYLLSLQHGYYRLEPNNIIQGKLMKPVTYSDKELYRISLELEPRSSKKKQSSSSSSSSSKKKNSLSISTAIPTKNKSRSRRHTVFGRAPQISDLEMDMDTNEQPQTPPPL